MSSLRTCKLGDLIEFQRGYDLPKSEFKHGPYPVQSSNGILGFHNEYKVVAPGVTIGRSGTVGLPHLLNTNFFPHNTALFVKDFKGNNVQYIYYLLKQLKLGDKGSGSGVPTMNRNHLHPLKIKAYRDGIEQEIIVKVLLIIDAKIALNNHINTELEAMAKTLYDYWFVQFDFPDANGKPYKTSGGKMVYNAALKRKIPEGWQNVNVLQVANLHGGGTPTKVKADYWHGEIPFFTPSDSDNNIFSLKTEDYITEKGLKNSSTKLFQKNTIFITARGSVGRLALNSVPMAMNQSCYALQAKDGISYAYLFFLTKELIHHLQVKASGSVFNSIVSSDIKHTNLAIPGSVKLIDVYKKIAEPTFEKINLITTENNQLETLRDYLLPMLMNGQVTVLNKDVI